MAGARRQGQRAALCRRWSPSLLALPFLRRVRCRGRRPGPRGPARQPARLRQLEGRCSGRRCARSHRAVGARSLGRRKRGDVLRCVRRAHCRSWDLAHQMSLQGPSGPQPTAVEMELGHLPVMVDEVLESLAPSPGSLHIDATVGGGGHSRRILAANSPDGRLLGLDADQAAIARTRERLAEFGQRVTLRQANFEELATVASEEGFAPADGILFDLGLSSYQLADPERAFSFRAEGPLDMRFDTSRGIPASTLIAELGEKELGDLFRRFGEEPHARRIARAIVEQRRNEPITTGAQLAEVIARAAPAPPRGRRRVHPATRVFQALRIAVNRELETLPVALAGAVETLATDGRLAVLSYHSLEDRIVKRFIQAERRGCICPPEAPVCICGRSPRLAPGGAQPRRPTADEIAHNPRARSALLRTARRLAA